jgi:hypothetical protein
MLRPGVVGIWHEGWVMISCRFSDNSQAGSRVRGGSRVEGGHRCRVRQELRARLRGDGGGRRHPLATRFAGRRFGRRDLYLALCAPWFRSPPRSPFAPDLPVEVALARHLSPSRGAPRMSRATAQARSDAVVGPRSCGSNPVGPEPRRFVQFSSAAAISTKNCRRCRWGHRGALSSGKQGHFFMEKPGALVSSPSQARGRGGSAHDHKPGPF